MPALTSASIAKLTIGRSWIGRRCLFVIRVSGWSLLPVPPARTTPFMTRSYVRRRAGLLDPSALAGDLAQRPPLRVRRAAGQAGLRVRAPKGRLHGLGRAGRAEAGGDLLVRGQVVEAAAGEPAVAERAHDLLL